MADFQDLLSGLGSWYSQLPNGLRGSWIDRGDRPGSNALGVPDSQQGIATPGRAGLGMFYDVEGPDGQRYRLRKTDIGPAAWTGRNIDISAAAADNVMGYSPTSFPTDATFKHGLSRDQTPDGPSQYASGSPFGNPRQAQDALPPEITGGRSQATDFSARARMPSQPPPLLSQMQPQQDPGFGDRLSAGFQGFAHGGALLPAIGNLLSGLTTGQRSDPAGMAQQNQMQFARALVAKGVSPQEAIAAAANPELAKHLLSQAYPTQQFHNVNGLYGAFNPNSGKFNPQGAVPQLEKVGEGQSLLSVTPPMPGQPNAGGAAGAPLGAPPGAAPAPPGAPALPNVQTLMQGTPKPPENYTWNDPKNPRAGVSAIPGSSATKLPASQAGQLALIQSAKPGFDAAKEYFTDPKRNLFLSPETGGTSGGPIRAAAGQATGSFEIGRMQRSVDIATEAALRTASGAAVPETEVTRYANFYRPSIYDTLATRKQKIDALGNFLEYAQKNINQGHVPPPEAFMGKSTSTASGSGATGSWTSPDGAVTIRPRR